LTMHFRYLKSVFRHKWFVFLAGVSLGVPLHQLALHDWTKFGPTEWLGYARKFYGGPYRSIRDYSGDVRNMVLSAGCYQEAIDAGFTRAWLGHQKRNKHHWQWWIVMEDSGKVYALPMPDRFRREMLADWIGANRAYGDTSLIDWYRKTKAARQLHPETLAWVEAQLGLTHCPVCGMNQEPCLCDCGGR
jgi:hypothetical protein